jgi:hypothetical protein
VPGAAFIQRQVGRLVAQPAAAVKELAGGTADGDNRRGSAQTWPQQRQRRKERSMIDLYNEPHVRRGSRVAVQDMHMLCCS